MSHFYLTLPSNSSQQFYPDNTMTDFTTKLPSTMELKGDWEASLSEISFVKTWKNLPSNSLDILVDCNNCDPKPFVGHVSEEEHLQPASQNTDPTLYQLTMRLKDGHYNNMEDLVFELNAAASTAFRVSTLSSSRKYTEQPTFYYKASANRMFAILAPGMSIKFPPALESIMGFSPDQNPLVNASKEMQTIQGNFACDLQAGIHALYVYCDLLHYSHVGDIKAPLLRVVPCEGEPDSVITRYYERPRYVPVQKKSFDSIHIAIRDDLGDKIQFENGKVLITLHFRKTKNLHFL